MTNEAGPNLVHSGLVFYVDAANSRSYSGSGNTVIDLKNQNNGTLINLPTYNSSNGGYFTFNGSSNYINVPTSSDITFTSGTNYSLSVWFYISSLPGRWTGIVTKSRDVHPWYGIWISTGNNYDWATPSGGSTLNLFGSLATTGWHNLCGVYDVSNNLSTLYVDGKYNASTAIGTSSTVGSGDLVIGTAKSVSEYLSGNISNVAIYNRALLSTEVLQNFNALKGRYGL